MLELCNQLTVGESIIEATKIHITKKAVSSLLGRRPCEESRKAGNVLSCNCQNYVDNPTFLLQEPMTEIVKSLKKLVLKPVIVTQSQGDQSSELDTHKYNKEVSEEKESQGLFAFTCVFSLK